MSRSNIRFVVCLMLIFWIVAVLPASAQHFQQMNIEGPGLSYIAAGRNEVWGLHYNYSGGPLPSSEEVYRFDPSTQRFVQVSGSLFRIALGGGTVSQPDEVWGIGNGAVYRFNYSTNAFVYVAGGVQCKYCLFFDFSQIAVGEGDYDNCHPYEVWALGGILGQSNTYRYNYCTDSFDEIAAPRGLCPPSPCTLTNVWVGSNDIWATDQNGATWHYQNTPNQIFGVTQNWALIEQTGGQGGLRQIAVGVNDVWGVTVGGVTVARWDPMVGLGPDNSPVGGFWVQPNDGLASDIIQIAAGGEGVWAIRPTDVCRWDSGSLRFRCIPLDAREGQIAVGSGAGVWVLNDSQQVFEFVRP